jgi:hypothetical protein
MHPTAEHEAGYEKQAFVAAGDAWRWASTNDERTLSTHSGPSVSPD